MGLLYLEDTVWIGPHPIPSRMYLSGFPALLVPDCTSHYQDLLHFTAKEQFEETEPASLNGLDQPEPPSLPIPQLPQETPATLEHEPEVHSLHLQPQHEESMLPTPSTLTADDMRRAKRIRVSSQVGVEVSPHHQLSKHWPPANPILPLPHTAPRHLVHHSLFSELLLSVFEARSQFGQWRVSADRVGMQNSWLPHTRHMGSGEMLTLQVRVGFTGCQACWC